LVNDLINYVYKKQFISNSLAVVGKSVNTIYHIISTMSPQIRGKVTYFFQTNQILKSKNMIFNTIFPPKKEKWS
jgi:hypothetical protein